MCGVEECSNFVLLHVAVQCSQYKVLKNLFSSLCILDSLVDRSTVGMWVSFWAFCPVCP